MLEKASTHRDEWQKPTVLKQMITRYYRFMQLKSSCPQNILLVPTLDIEIVWQTHLLRPTMYRADCLRLFHRIIDHSLLTSNIEQYLKEQAFVDTCQLYEQRFGEPYCPLPEGKKERAKYVVTEDSTLRCVVPIYSYWDETYFQFSTEAPASYENPFSFTEADIILDGQWLDLCERFMSEMLKRVKVYSTSTSIPDQSKPIDLRIPAIKRLKKSYERFLYLAAIYPPVEGYNFVHPTYAIDIIWHSHMQEPLKYASDTTRLVGYIIDHAPWPWVEMSKLMNSCDNTNDNWKLEFDNELSTDHLYNIEGKDDLLWN